MKQKMALKEMRETGKLFLKSIGNVAKATAQNAVHNGAKAIDKLDKKLDGLDKPKAEKSVEIEVEEIVI